MKAYPYRRVLVGFSLCPGIVGLAFGVEMAIYSLAKESSAENFWYVVDGFFIFPLLFIVCALIFYGIPAFLLAVIYTLLKIKKNLAGFIFIIICGGLGAFLWATRIWPKPDPEIKSVIAAVNALFSGHFIEYFFLGAISSILMGLYVLPREVLSSDEPNT
jgi:hypothetical protein